VASGEPNRAIGQFADSRVSAFQRWDLFFHQDHEEASLRRLVLTAGRLARPRSPHPAEESFLFHRPDLRALLERALPFRYPLRFGAGSRSLGLQADLSAAGLLRRIEEDPNRGLVAPGALDGSLAALGGRDSACGAVRLHPLLVTAPALACPGLDAP
jgi:hypothetical protein